MLLYGARSSVLVEYTFGNARKHVDHRVNSFLLRCVRELQYSQTIAEEFAVEESIHQIELAYYVDKAQNLAGEVPIHVRVVILKAQFVAELKQIGLNENELDLTRSSPSLIIYPLLLPSWSSSNVPLKLHRDISHNLLNAAQCNLVLL